MLFWISVSHYLKYRINALIYLFSESEQWTTLDGKPAGDIWDALAGVYETKDGHVRIHTNFPQSALAYVQPQYHY